MVQDNQLGTNSKVLMGSAGAVGAVAAVSGLTEIGKVCSRSSIYLHLPSSAFCTLCYLRRAMDI